MPNYSFSSLQIRLLLKCEQEPMTKSNVSKLYKKLEKDRRVEEITELIKAGMLTEKAMPKIGVNKTPVFYFLTEEGKNWVDQYHANYPRIS